MSVLLLLTTLVTLAGAAPSADASGDLVLDAGLTAKLRTALDARRAASGLDPLFPRDVYQRHAETMARQAADETGVTPAPPDGAPATWLGWTVPTDMATLEGGSAVAMVDQALASVTSFALHTDGGWAVVRRDTPSGTRLGVAAVVGWPAAVMPKPSGCAEAGYCWRSGGLNPHLSWTRNQVKVYASTQNLPAGGEAALKAGIARLNAVSGFGADVVYGGRTTATTTSSSRRFVVTWRDSGCSATALACTSVDTQGTPSFIFGGRILVMRAQWAAYRDPEYWVGTFAHEIGHAVGLGHFDSVYAGSHQLMRWAAGPNTPRAGDVNGLRRVNPAGRLVASLRMPARVRAGQPVTALVRAGSTGLGGVRQVAVQCTDGNGAVRTFASRRGAYDIRARDYGLGWTVPGGRAYAGRCRALVTSKATRTYSAWVPVTLGG